METELSSFWWNYHHWWHRKLSTDNFRCSQWWKFLQNVDISISLNVIDNKHISNIYDDIIVYEELMAWCNDINLACKELTAWCYNNNLACTGLTAGCLMSAIIIPFSWLHSSLPVWDPGATSMPLGMLAALTHWLLGDVAVILIG